MQRGWTPLVAPLGAPGRTAPLDATRPIREPERSGPPVSVPSARTVRRSSRPDRSCHGHCSPDAQNRRRFAFLEVAARIRAQGNDP